MQDFLLILTASILGLLAHLARKNDWLTWVLKAAIFLAGFAEFVWLIILSLKNFIGRESEPQKITVLTLLAPATCLILFVQIRELVSRLCTFLELIMTLQILVPVIRKKVKPKEYFERKRIFVPTSLPHLIALCAYITAAAYLYVSVQDRNTVEQLPELTPSAILFERLLSPNGISLILLSFCGIGIFVSRNFKEALRRLGLVKPHVLQIVLGIFLIFISFTYDALWAVCTHHLAGEDLATQLSGYNSGTFTVAGTFAPSVILAIMIALCTGVSEELLIRGALQPVFGILPAAFLHGMLHAQMAHAPVLIVKITIWSAFMGFIRRYTNTTTTIIGHAGVNLTTILLFAANP
jgi:hypothetical protein